MKEKSAILVVFATFAAIVSFLFVAGDANSEMQRLSLSLPTGTGTPEGAASDLVRSFVERNEELFRERRCVVGCETPFDVERSWLQFAASQLGAGSQDDGGLSEDVFHPTRIVRVLPARQLDLSDEQKAMHWAGLWLNFGACESVLVDVVTADAAGQQFETQVEAQRLTTWSPELERSIPVDEWRARVQRTVAVRNSSPENSSLSREAVE